MEQDIIERVLLEARYITQYRTTLRNTAKALGVAKSTIHKDLTIRLPFIDKKLYREVKKLLAFNLSVRHIRGGMARARSFINKKNNSLNADDE